VASPEEAQLLSDADIVIWIGAPLEAAMAETLGELARTDRVVDLVRTPGLVRYKLRSGGVWQAAADDSGREGGSSWLGWGTDSAAEEADPAPAAAEGAPSAGEAPGEAAGETPIDVAGIDGHIWPDPLNAQLMVDRIIEVLSRADRDNATDYRRNGENVKNRLKRLDEDMEAMLAPARGKPFLVINDAYQYLEVRYALAGAGSLVVDPDGLPATAELDELHHRIEAQHAACVFGGPSVPSDALEAAVEGTGAQAAELDPLGIGIPDGIDLYFMMMRRVAATLKTCLTE
jgi:zinc transport system substrate-binding protein